MIFAHGKYGIRLTLEMLASLTRVPAGDVQSARRVYGEQVHFCHTRKNYEMQTTFMCTKYIEF